jgi:hypothetical protein
VRLADPAPLADPTFADPVRLADPAPSPLAVAPPLADPAPLAVPVPSLGLGCAATLRVMPQASAAPAITATTVFE